MPIHNSKAALNDRFRSLEGEWRARGALAIVIHPGWVQTCRSLADFVRLVDLFDEHGVSFVSVTQQFNTSTSMGRLTLHVLLSFARFEREVTGERIRDKIAVSKHLGGTRGMYELPVVA